MKENDSHRTAVKAGQVLAVVAGALGVFALGVWTGSRVTSAPEEVPSKVETPIVSRVVVTPALPPLDLSEVEVPRPVEEYEVPGIAGARIAVVVDDLGRSLRDLEMLNGLGIPLTYSVLPFEVRTGSVAAEIRRQGWELMCHLPMEAQSGANPGPGALTSAMSPDELGDATRAALAAVPGAVGVNNHMGSSLSADELAMRPVLDVIREYGLFFVDSRTSASSVGYRVALDLGIAAAERQVFLDAELTPESIEEQFDRLLWLAQDRGEAVAIGHPHAMTIEVLSRRIPEAIAAGFEFVPVSYLLDRSSPPE